MEQRSDLPILRLQIEDTNGNMVVHQHSAPGGLILPQSVEGVTDDELICNVGANLVSGVAGVDDAVVESDVDVGNACGNVFADGNYVVGCAEGEAMGDNDVSFAKNVSDDKFVDARLTEENRGQDATNSVNNPGNKTSNN